MRRVGVGLLGLVIGLALVWYLAYTEVIEIGLFSPSYGLWLIPAVLIGTPAVLLLLDAGQWKPALVIVAVLLVFASPRLVEVGRRMQERHAWRRQAQAEQNRVEQLRTQQRRRGETLALEAFGTEKDVQTVVRPDQCGGVLVQVTGQGRIMWYWYDSAQDRIAASLSEQQLGEYISPYLPPGGRVTSFQNYQQRTATAIYFSYKAQGTEYEGQAWFAEGCGLVLDRLGINGPVGFVMVQVVLPIGGPATPELARQQQQVALQAAARKAALADFGGSGYALATASSPRETACTKLVVRVNDRPGQATWYWVDAAAGRVLGKMTPLQLRKEIEPYLPAGIALGKLLPTDGINPLVIPFDIGGPQEMDQVRAWLSDNCTFTLEWINIDPQGARVPVSKPLPESP